MAATSTVATASFVLATLASTQVAWASILAASSIASRAAAFDRAASAVGRSTTWPA